jgi:integrase
VQPKVETSEGKTRARAGFGWRVADRAGLFGTLGFEIGAHALRATAATNARDHQADIAKVQEWQAHANISTTRIYDRH